MWLLWKSSGKTVNQLSLCILCALTSSPYKPHTLTLPMKPYKEYMYPGDSIEAHDEFGMNWWLSLCTQYEIILYSCISIW